MYACLYPQDTSTLALAHLPSRPKCPNGGRLVRVECRAGMEMHGRISVDRVKFQGGSDPKMPKVSSV